MEHGAGIAIISGAAYDPQRDRGLCSVDLSHIVAPTPLTIVLDPLRYLRGYAYDFIGMLAPEWTRKKVDNAIKDVVSSPVYPGH